MSNVDIAASLVEGARKSVKPKDEPDLLRQIMKAARIRLSEIVGHDSTAAFLAGQSGKALREAVRLKPGGRR
jgi:hypothetical protein